MSNLKKSLGYEKEVHGIKVKKLHIGAFISAMEEIGNLPSLMLEKLFPDKSSAEALYAVRFMNREDMLKVICKALTVLPRELINFLSSLLDEDAEKLSVNLTPVELLDVLTEFWEINEIENFIKKAKALVMTVK